MPLIDPVMMNALFGNGNRSLALLELIQIRQNGAVLMKRKYFDIFYTILTLKLVIPGCK